MIKELIIEEENEIERKLIRIECRFLRIVGKIERRMEIGVS